MAGCQGDTTGATQRLLRIEPDCDRDAVRSVCIDIHPSIHPAAFHSASLPCVSIRFTVLQQGDPKAFCHRNTLTCWGPPTGITALEEVLQRRYHSAAPGSYTQKLFNDPNLLRWAHKQGGREGGVMMLSCLHTVCLSVCPQEQALGGGPGAG